MPGSAPDCPIPSIARSAPTATSCASRSTTLAGFLLTLELLELVRESAPARIVNVASLGQQALDFDDLMLEHDYDGQRAYWQSKLAQIMSGDARAELSRRSEQLVGR